MLEASGQASAATATHDRVRAFRAFCIALGALAVFFGYVLDPSGGLRIPPLPDVIAQGRAASPLRIDPFMLSNAVAMYLGSLLATPAMLQRSGRGRDAIRL